MKQHRGLEPAIHFHGDDCKKHARYTDPISGREQEIESMASYGEPDAQLAAWILSTPAMLEEYLNTNPGPQGLLAIEKAILDESVICTADHARAACLYAHVVVQGRWKAGERVILEATRLVDDHFDEPCTNVAEAAESYRELAFGREAWPELVAMIRGGQCHPYFVISYCLRSQLDLKAEVSEGLLNTPVSDEDEAAEQEKRSHLASAAESYADLVIKGRWEDGEKLLSGFPFEMYSYARFTLNRPLPEHLHSEMVMRSFETPEDRDIKDYLKWCDEWAAAARGESS
jgi:hypothetical protein